MKKQFIISIFSIFLLSFTSYANENKTPLVYKISLKDEINSSTWIYVQKGMAEARKLEAKQIIIHMNTYGGEVIYADSIRTKILNSEIPVSVFIDNNAASAGALISIACKNIYMRKGASIGAATVVDQSGEQLPDKYQSYMRATIRTTAEAHGKDTIVNGKDTIIKWKRNPLIAEAMVDDRIAIPNVIDSGKTLTFTTQEALKYGYCEGTAESVEEVIEQHLGYDKYELKEFKPSFYDKIKGFLTGSLLRGLLIMIIIGGIYFELQTPGVGFPLAAAAVAAVLYFAPLYLDGLAANWEIILFVLGLILLGLEIFVIPGFGVAGVSGIIFIITGLTLAMVNNDVFDFKPVKVGAIGEALFTVLGGIVFGVVAIVYLSSRIGTKGLFTKVALNTTQEISEGYIGVSLEQQKLIGCTGVSGTVLRPSGKVILNNQSYDAVSEEGFIEKGTEVKVVRYEQGQLYVVKEV